MTRETTEPELEASIRIEEVRKSRADKLDLSGLELTSLPKAIFALTQLKTLDLGGNRLDSLPESLGRLTCLESLYLVLNQLNSLPDSIGKLNNLRELEFNANRLSSLPRSLADLKNLRALNLSENLFTSVPDVIRSLPRLEFLWLEKNPLQSLPQWMGAMSTLRELHIEDTRLKTLPDSLRELKSLAKLYLHGNNGLQLPPEVLGPSYIDVELKDADPARPVEVLEYYFRVSAGKQPLNEAKLILVGFGAVGKTSLVNRLVNNKFYDDEDETQGIQITKWPITLGEENVRLNIWDFGGQEIMHSTHQFFLTQRSLYLLVLDGRQGHEDADADYWLNLIRSFGQDAPVIVVLNKMDTHHFDLNRRGLKDKFSGVRDFVETDCKTGTGINNLRRIVECETSNLKHLRDPFPRSWFSIKDDLAASDKSYMSFGEYRKLCEERGERNHDAQEKLAVYLHNLGVALNYKDDLRLRNTHVLNPHWVTEGVYTLLVAKELARLEGKLRLEQVGEILDPEKYPEEMHRFLLELMQKFDLCVSFPEPDGGYLVPEHLDKQQPPKTTRFNPEQCLSFQYHYPIQPEGLLPRFIVRSHVLNAGQPKWRTGVILEFEGNRALVKADLQDRKIEIAVSGPKAGRRRLLAIIRSDFEHIHQKFPEPQEMVAIPEHPTALVPYRKLLILERENIKKHNEVASGEDRVLKLDVEELLNGVDLEGMRHRSRTSSLSPKAARVFLSYSHKDEKLRKELETHLKLMERLGMIQCWSDRRITAGDEWKGKLDEHLENADIVLLLVSPDFFASDYCYDIEMRRALERQEAGETRVVPVIVRDVDWTPAPFGKLQALPAGGKAVEAWRKRDTAWRSVVEGIEKVVKAQRRVSG